MTGCENADVHLAAAYDADTAPQELLMAARPYESNFGTSFASFTLFDAPLLAALNAPQEGNGPAGLIVASDRDPSVIDDLSEITSIAQLEVASMADKQRYQAALLRIYGKLGVSARELAAMPDVLCVGPEREGRQLAEIMGSLPKGRSITPSAKRISYRGGLVIGMSPVQAPAGLPRCLILDGVVASGATVMALLGQLAPTIGEVTLLTAQATAAGCWAIHRYADLLQIKCQLVVGHVSGELNSSFYATVVDNPDVLVLGDVGDMISGIGDARP